MKKFGLLALAAAMLVACNNATNPVVSDPISSVEESSISQPIESEPSESEPSESEPVELEPLMPEEAINYIATAWGGEGELIEEGVWGAACIFDASETPIDDLKLYVEVSTPEQFAVANEWEVDTDNVWSIAYINEVDTVLEYYVYADIVYLDANGNIKFEQAEGLTPLDVTCLEVYGYTYVEPVDPGEPQIASISINDANLLGYNGTNVTYGDGSVTINEINFSYIECGAYGNGIQMRTKNGKSSTILNLNALPAPLKSIDIQIADGKAGYSNEHALYFTFGETAEELGNEVALDTVADQAEYNITVPEGVNAYFFKLVHGTSYSLYIDSITLNF